MKSKKRSKLSEWQDRCKSGTAVCAKCGTKDNLTVDHIIPIAILEPLCRDLGFDSWYLKYDNEANFQILCQYDNRAKNMQLDVRNPKTLPLLKKLIEKIEYANTNLQT